MRRREFITLLGGAAAWPLTARGQQPAMPVVGFLHSGSPEPNAKRVAAFRTTSAALAAKETTTTVPIVSSILTDPIGNGLATK
jgi:hypothetical protein